MRQNYNFSDNTTKSAIKKELIFTLAENRSADTHHCAALFHRYAVVLAHPHAYRPEIILAGHRSRCKTVEHPADFTEFFMNFRHIICISCHTHNAANPDIAQRIHHTGIHQSLAFLTSKPEFRGFKSHMQLQKYISNPSYAS